MRPDLIDWEKFYLRSFHWGFRPLGVTDLVSMSCIPLTPEQTQTESNLVAILDSLIFTCTDKSTIQIWSMGDGKSQGTIDFPHKSIKCFSCSEKDRVLSIGCEDGSVTFYYVQRRSHKRTLTGESLPQCEASLVFLCSITFDQLIGISDGVLCSVQLLGEHFALLTQDGVLLLFQIKLPIVDASGHKAGVHSLRIIHTLINNTTTNAPVTMILRQASQATGVILLVALDLLILDGSHEMAVQEFYAEGCSLVSSRYFCVGNPTYSSPTESSDSEAMEGAMPSAAVTCLAFGGPIDDILLVTGHGDNTVHVWRFNADQITHSATLFGHTGAISCVTVDDHAPVRVITGAKDRRVKVWSLLGSSGEDGTLLMTLEDHECPLASLATKEDLRLVSGDVNGCWKLWNFDS
ncbi:Elongator subunit elp2 [Entomophthora muscae]|uniref:Elongator subunit elp2 n=1 Tax=Entomophthora muscae TaxID=34485 RepID=A0ACC2S8L0_9FUNG|nr:Elongator subunit elp2 [Entomophthora muscae]